MTTQTQNEDNTEDLFAVILRNFLGSERSRILSKEQVLAVGLFVDHCREWLATRDVVAANPLGEDIGLVLADGDIVPLTVTPREPTRPSIYYPVTNPPAGRDDRAIRNSTSIGIFGS